MANMFPEQDNSFFFSVGIPCKLSCRFFFISIKVGQLKDMDKVKAWTDHVILHFWHCASSCKESETTSDEAALEIMKVCALSFLPQYRAPYKWVRGNLHLLL